MTPRRFRLIHAVIGFELLAIAACFAVPALREDAALREAAHAAHDLQEVAVAATTAHAKLGEWPEDGTPGDVPPSLKGFLPARASFDHGSYKLNWDHWRLSDGYAQASEFAGVSVITDDPRLLSLITAQVGTRRTHFTLGNRAIFMVSDPGVATP
jgi:hypothetical protein